MEIGYLDTPEEWRDLFLMMFTAAGTIVFILSFFFIAVIGMIATTTMLRTRRILKDNVGPAMENVRMTTSTVRTTVDFVSDYAVRPVAKAYGTFAGARKFVTVISRMRRKGG